MSNNLLDEYKAYYATRAEIYANNPNYKFSYEAEKDLSDAIQTCTELEEFKNNIGNKNELCAVALIKDEALIEKTFFEKYKEEIRKLGPLRISEKADLYDNVMDLVGMVNEESTKNSIEISMDEANRQLMYDWDLIDTIEIYSNAEVPSEYKKDMQNAVDEAEKSLNENVTDLEKNNASWQDGWRLNPDAILEYRHIRHLPYSEEHIKEQLSQYKSIINR